MGSQLPLPNLTEEIVHLDCFLKSQNLNQFYNFVVQILLMCPYVHGIMALMIVYEGLGLFVARDTH